MILQAVQKYLLFLIIFFTISQFGKHFWPYFAYVSGIRVDYLSPTLYVTDLLIILLFGLWVVYKIPRIQLQQLRIPLVVHSVLFVLAISIIVAKYSMPALYGSVKALEMAFVGYMVSRHISEKNVSLLCFLLSGAVLIESVLVFLQMVTQASVGGLWYFLGERTFSVASIGISTVSVFETEVLRAYGSFPHPNVLAFFLVYSGTLFIYELQRSSNTGRRIWYTSMIGVSTLTLIATFSRLSIVVWLAILVYVSVRRLILRAFGIAAITIVGLFMVVFIQRFSVAAFLSQDLYHRIDLARIALKIIQEHVLFGVGINNYFYYQIDYQRSITPVLLQPVHNVFLLILLQVGIVGSIGIGFFLVKTIMRAKKLLLNSPASLQSFASLLIVSFFVIGMGDHYFLTLQQGMILTATLFGLVWIPSKITE